MLGRGRCRKRCPFWDGYGGCVGDDMVIGMVMGMVIDGINILRDGQMGNIQRCFLYGVCERVGWGIKEGDF